MIVLALAACAGDPATDDDTALEPATLTRVQAEVFTPSCAFSTCHASPGASGLVLEDGRSFDALIDVDSHDNPGRSLVVPGDSAGSYLVAKLKGDADIVGLQMPYTGGALEAERLQLVVDWIDAGAADD